MQRHDEGMHGRAAGQVTDLIELAGNTRTDDDVAARAEPTRNGRALSDDRDAGVDDVGAFEVGNGDVAFTKEGIEADGHLLIDNAAVDEGARAHDGAVMDD